MFLKKIQQQNYEGWVRVNIRRPRVIARPIFSSPLERFDPGAEATGSIQGNPSVRPGVGNGREEGGVFEPAVLKLEANLGNNSGDVEDEGDMVGSGTEAGGESGIGERRAKSSVDKNAIKASKGGSGSPSGPGIEPVK